jgi:Raf kinase inhibitor-like YbhB/YbcL family protein
MGPALAAFVLLSACGGGGAGTTSPVTASGSIRVASPAFASGGTIPVRFTCDGRDVSPPMRWTARGSSMTALMMTDPDAPGGTFVHWVLVVPGARATFGEGSVPPGATESTNGFGKVGYGGPCPPSGDPPHHYVFTVYALPRSFSSGSLPTDASDALGAIEQAAGARGSVTATYGR